MIIIAENLNTRNRPYVEAVQSKDMEKLGRLARELIDSKAEVINIQCSFDGMGDEKTLPMVTEAVQKTSDVPLALDSRNVDALKEAIKLCEKPPMLNFLSLDEKDPEKILTLCRENKCSLIVRALKGIIPTSLEGKLQILENLIEMANAADIPNGRLFADPSVVHLGRGMGQEHIVNSHECILALNEMVDPPINTISWVSNISSGLSKSVKSEINSTFLSYLAGAGLSAAMIDVMDKVVMKTVYLLKSFKDEVVFSEAELEG